MKNHKRKAKTTARKNGGGDSPEAVLSAIDKFVASRRDKVDKLTDRAIKAKKANPAQHRALQAARK